MRTSSVKLKAIEAKIPKRLVPRGKKLGGPKFQEISGIEELDLHQMCRMYMIGLCDEEVCFNLKISGHTLLRLKHQYPEVRQACETGKDYAIDRIEQSLYKRAIGTSVKEVTKEPASYFDPLLGKVITNKKLFTTKIVNKELPGDVTAAMRVLVNRRGDKWKDSVPGIAIQQNNFGFQKVEHDSVDQPVIGRASRNSELLQRFGIENSGAI